MVRRKRTIGAGWENFPFQALQCRGGSFNVSMERWEIKLSIHKLLISTESTKQKKQKINRIGRTSMETFSYTFTTGRLCMFCCVCFFSSPSCSILFFFCSCRIMWQSHCSLYLCIYMWTCHYHQCGFCSMDVWIQ